jgi:hypothetical protein
MALRVTGVGGTGRPALGLHQWGDLTDTRVHWGGLTDTRVRGVYLGSTLPWDLLYHYNELKHTN